MMSAPAMLLDISGFNRSPALSADEHRALIALDWDLRRRRGYASHRPEWASVARLVVPLDAARLALRDLPDTRHHRRTALDAVGLVLHRCAESGSAFWGWSTEDWAGLIGRDRAAFENPWPGWLDPSVRSCVAAYAYLLGNFDAFHQLGSFNRFALIWRVFGRAAVERAIDEVAGTLNRLGYRSGLDDPMIRTTVCELLLRNRSPHLQDLTDDALARLGADAGFATWAGGRLYAVHRALAELGVATPPAIPAYGRSMPVEGVPAAWLDVVDRWFATATQTPEVRLEYRSILTKTGRWMAREQPGVEAPGDWTRATCAAFVARIDRMTVGDFAQRRVGLDRRAGQPLAATSKATYLSVVRAFFRDCHEWGWCPPRFDPSTALATPRAIRALMFPKPRVIADDLWAKLLWAGLNLTAEDVAARGIVAYPVELVRALAITWLFAAQRSDEIVRLRVGCVRWQPDAADPAAPPVCLLDVPVHKTGAAFTKPVDPLVGRAIEAWEAVRPAQPPIPDRKTGEPVDILFACRGIAVANTYINNSIIPFLCAKGGVPPADVRGRITSHRARATIASQLYNAKEPMTLFELQAWLGHRSPETTRHYAAITPNTLTRAYADAGYFARNVRTITVLIDRQAVENGAAAAGEPWQHYDLGHGYCSYTFFEQCPHRMACARCDFYLPKASSKAQLLEAKEGMQHRLATIPLTEDEQAAVENDRAALDRLLGRLVDTPTPAGPTPREMTSAPAPSAGAASDGTATRAPASDSGTKPPDDRPLSSPTPPLAVARKGQA